MLKWTKLWNFIKNPRVYWRIFALVLAIIFWLLSAGEGDLGATERVVSVPIRLTNIPADQSIVERPDTVRIRLRGLAPLLSLAEEGLEATVDLSAAVDGEGTYGVQVATPTGVELVSITPRWVRIRTEEIIEKEYAVTLGLLGGYPPELMPSISTDPRVVVAQGSRSILERINQVVAYIVLGEDLAELNGAVPVRALDSGGRSLEGVQLSPAEVQVVVEQIQPETD